MAPSSGFFFEASTRSEASSLRVFSSLSSARTAGSRRAQAAQLGQEGLAQLLTDAELALIDLLLSLVALLDRARGEELAGEVLDQGLALVELLGLVMHRARLQVDDAGVGLGHGPEERLRGVAEGAPDAGLGDGLGVEVDELALGATAERDGDGGLGTRTCMGGACTTRGCGATTGSCAAAGGGSGGGAGRSACCARGGR